jgi:ATP-dependent DNA helicase UvrD/PcrA
MQTKEDQASSAIRNTARRLLVAYHAAVPSWQGEIVPLDALAAWLGLDVETFNPDDYPPGTFGFLDPQERLIWLCRGLPLTLRRFTLAHELGHAILHRRLAPPALPASSPSLASPAQPSYARAISGGPPLAHPGLQDGGATREDPCLADDVRESCAGPVSSQPAEDMLGPGISSAAYNPRSQRELDANLFAAELLMPLDRVYALYLSRETPLAKLAGLFGVSQPAMLNRLSETALNPTFPSIPSIRRGEGGVDVEGGPLWSPVPGGATAPSPLRNAGHDGDEIQTRRPYDPYQLAAIEAQAPALIVAGPGSGKTSTLIGRVEYLIHAQGVQPQHILALTFSRKAAQEMQERLQQALAFGNRDHRSQPAQFPTVSTFHAFCAGLLREHGDLVGLRPAFSFIDDAEGYFLLRRLGAQLPLHHYQNLANPAAPFPTILSAISRAKDELTTPAMYRRLAQTMLDEAREARAALEGQGAAVKQIEEELERAEKSLEIAEIYALYQRQLEQQGDTDFGGLIMLAVQLLRDYPGVRAEIQERYRHILVDEFQDINRASGVLLRLLAGEERRVWVVGDPNQAIYGFRGASPANIANFREDYPDAVVLPLSRNYRSRPDIVSASASFRHTRLEPGAASISAESARPTRSDAYITLARAPDEASELRGIVEDIRRKREQGYAFRDIVALCRTRALARKVTRALAGAGLPVIERGGMLEQEHIRALLSVLMLLTDYGSMGILRAARQPDHPFSQADIEALLLATREERPGEQQQTLRQLLLSGHAPPGLSSAGQRSFARLSAILKTLYFTPSLNTIWLLLAQYLFIETSIGRSLLAPAVNRGPTTSEALGADYADLLALARYFDAQQQAILLHETQQRGALPGAPEIPPIAEQVKAFLDYLTVLLSLRQDGSSRREAAEQGDGEVPDVIRVMTVHASKGLEFPVVYLPGIVNQKFPATRRSHPAPPPRGMVAAGSDENAAHETGEACLFYVAATRARDHLVISCAERYGKKTYKPSIYLQDLAASLPGERLTRIAWPASGEPGAANEADEESGVTGEDADLDGPFSSRPGAAFLAASQPQTLRISDIETYQRCPRQYLYGSIYRFRSEAAAYQRFRKAAQLTLDDLQKHIEAAREAEYGETAAARFPTAEQARELYTRHWRAAGGHTAPFAPLYEQHGHEVADLLRRKLLEKGNTGWQLSPTFTVDVAGLPIEVTVDRVEVPPPGEVGASEPARFVKTGYGRRKSKVDPTARELLYAHAYRQHHPLQPIELRFHNMSTGETFEIKLTQRKEQNLYQELEKALDGLARHAYPPKPDPFVCPGCPFFLICPA